MFLSVAVLTSLLAFQLSNGVDISSGKMAKQVSTTIGYEAAKAINEQFKATGAFTNNHSPAWWILDLGGHFFVVNIKVTATRHSDWSRFMANAQVGVSMQDVSLYPDATRVECGVVSSVVLDGQNFQFNCPSSPAKFVYIWREEYMLSLGHVEVQGSAVDKCGSSTYGIYGGVKLMSSSVTKTTGAESVADCSAQCYRHHGCTTFSFSTTADSAANCIFADDPVDYDNAPGWTSHVLE